MNRGLLGPPKRGEIVRTTVTRPDERDLLLWLRADEHVTKDASDRVSAWGDCRDMSRALGQGVSGNQPLWVDRAFDDLPVIRFEGGRFLGSLNLSAINRSDYTLFLVTARRAGGGNFVCGGTGFTSYQTLHVGWHSERIFRVGHWLNDLSAPASPYVLGDLVSVTATLRQGYGRLLESLGWLLARTTESTPLQGGQNPFQIGLTSNGAYTGDVAELLVYTRALRAAERRAVEAYLVARWPSLVPMPLTGW